MVDLIITAPQESESIFSRGKETSTITESVDEDSYAYEGHLLMEEHLRSQRPEERDSYQSTRRMSRENFDNRPPRPPGQFSFSAVGRRKRSESSTVPNNPFNEQSSNEGSNSIVSEDSPPIYHQRQHHPPSHSNAPSPTMMSTNPFDETSSADFVETTYPAKTTATTTIPTHPTQSTTLVPDHRTHSWDSDRQFPILEIERIKRKTRKLRGSSGGNQASAEEHNNNNDDDDDDGFGREPVKVFPHVVRSATTTTTASVTTGAQFSDARSSNGTVLRRQPSLTKSVYSQAGSRTPPPRPHTNHISVVKSNRYFPAVDSLAEVLDQNTVQTDASSSSAVTPRSKASEQAELRLIQSFHKPRRSRPEHSQRRSLTPVQHSLNEKQLDDRVMQTTTTETIHYGKKHIKSMAPPCTTTSPNNDIHSTVNLPPPEDAPKSIHSFKNTQEEPSTPETSRDTSQDTTPSHEEDYDDALMHASSPVEPLNLTLHDLCGEATHPDDITWRNALYLLSIQPSLATVVDTAEGHFTPLHVCCLGPRPAPSFMILALLYTHPDAAQTPDEGGRLPLHLAAASSADTATMELLVNQYPAGVSHVDDYGMTPLHLYLRNVSVDWDPEIVKLLLGNSTSMLHKATDSSEARNDDDGPQHFLFRRGSHFKFPADEVRRSMKRPRPVTRFTKIDHEAAIAQYSPDVQVSLRKLSRWRTKQQNRALLPPASSKWSQGGHLDADRDLANQHFISPASIPTRTNLQLPIHMVIHRALQQMERNRDMQDMDDNDDDDALSQSENNERKDLLSNAGSDMDAEQPSFSPKSPLSDPNVLEVIRMLAEAYPEGLATQDEDGLTPLVMILLADEQTPNFDLVLLLLGRRTPGGAQDWKVDQDLPLHSLSSSHMWMNPAMVPSTWTKQLPLHIVAEEYLSELPLVQVIFDAYPAAIQVQDAQGRTPLHLALSSYRKQPVHPMVMSMLFCDSVAQTRDRKGNLPMDIMLENSQVLPDTVPWAWKLVEASDPAVGTVYQRFFHSSLLHLASCAHGSDGRDFLHDLQVLPQWLRRQACVSTFVQELLIDEISTPWKCAVILLDGLLLVGLLTVFRLQMNEYIVTGSSLATWYTFAVYAFAAARFLLLGTWAALASRLGQYYDSILCNTWWWIDYAGMILAIVTSVLLNGTIDDDILLSLGTAATGLLWWSVIGYVSRWSFSMAVFSGVLSQLTNYVFCILVAFGAVVIAFGQMLFTVFQTDCQGAISASSVCTERDSYRVLYLLLRGESLADVEGRTQMTAEAITMVATFLFFMFVVAVGLLAVVVLVAGQADVDEIARKAYWEPMLAYVMSMNTLGVCGRFKQRTCGDAMSTKLGFVWDMLTFHFTGQGEYKDKTTWFARPQSLFLSAPLMMLSVLILPLWFLLGLLSLGLFWPPQLRRALFRPALLWQRRKTVLQSTEAATQQLHNLRSEATKFKVLSYDRMTSIEHEIRELKDLLCSAVREDF